MINSNFLSTAPPHIEGTNLVQYGEAIPCFQSCPNLAEGMNFPNFEIAIHYCTEFGRFNGFAVRKKKLKKTVMAVSGQDVLTMNIQVKLGIIIESWLETKDQKKQNALGM